MHNNLKHFTDRLYYKDIISVITIIVIFQTNKVHVDHQAMAYVAPKRVVNGDENKSANTNGTTNGVNGTAKPTKKFPKWGGAEICPRCERSVSVYIEY